MPCAFIGQVKAIDKDEGKNAQIFYFLVSDERNRLLNDDFRVDIKTGMIHTNDVLDRERIDSYLLYIRASPSPIISVSICSNYLPFRKKDLNSFLFAIICI